MVDSRFYSYRLALSGALMLLLGLSGTAFADPIYVFREASGSIRFTNRPPPDGGSAKVFTARAAGFSIYRGLGYRVTQLFKNRHLDLIRAASERHGVEPHLIQAVIHVESAFNPRAVSPKGARGLMQLMPDTARLLGVKNSFVPEENVEGGVRYLASLLQRFKGNQALALAAYNAGEGAVERFGGIPPFTETQLYVRRVLELSQRYQRALHEQ